MKAKSIKAKSTEEIKSVLSDAMSDGFSPTLATVFMSAKQDWKAVSELLDSNGIEVFGATSEIAFTDNGIENDGIIILLMEMNKSHFKIVLREFKNEIPGKVAGKIADFGKSIFSNPAYIISGSLSDSPGELLMDGIVEKAGKDVIITGGMAVSGFKPVGTEKIITKSDGGWIQTIDNKPAMEVIWQFIGRDLDETKISDQLVMLNTAYPLQLKRKVGKPIMRPTVMYNTETKAVFCGGSVVEGSAFRFSLPPDFDVIDAAIESSKEIKETELEEADAVLIFSCIGRYGTLGPMVEEENNGIAETWGKPMAGFFSMGEFGKVKGGEVPEFHGGTCCWVAIKEK